MKLKVIKGTNKIGGCVTEIVSNRGTKIIFDFGKELDNENDDFELEGLTYGVPKYDAVFITHSHGDHIALAYKILKDIRIYVEYKTLKIHNISCDFMKDMAKLENNTEIFNLSDNLSSGQF